DGLHMPHALLAQNLLDAADRIAVPVQQVTDATQQIDVVGPVVTPPAAALQRLDLCETSFPETQHMLRQVKVFSHLADGAKGIGSFFHRQSHWFPQRFLSWRSLIRLFNIFEGLK